MIDSNILGIAIMCIITLFFAFLFTWQQIGFLKDDVKIERDRRYKLQS